MKQNWQLLREVRGLDSYGVAKIWEKDGKLFASYTHILGLKSHNFTEVAEQITAGLSPDTYDIDINPEGSPEQAQAEVDNWLTEEGIC